MGEPEIPCEVVDWLRSVFRQCNSRASGKMMLVPTAHEESLDLSIIEELSRFGSRVRLPCDWLVRVDTHWLGGRRHFESWEIADVGVLIVIRRAGRVVRSKVALLQSKRLYPQEQPYEEAELDDYRIGFARLFPPDSSFAAVAEPRTFTFDVRSEYRALRVADPQFQAIANYEEQYQIPVYYLLYHPFTLPYSVDFPLSGMAEPDGTPGLGCRVVPAPDLRGALEAHSSGYCPRFEDLAVLKPEPRFGSQPPGWLLENFVADLVLTCRAGYLAKDQDDPGLVRVFTRRTGPIAAAISITVDSP